LALAIFDLDNTLIAGDSDHAWGEYLVERGLVDRDLFARKNDEFYASYVAGNLDLNAYLDFSLEPLSRFDEKTLQELHNDFMEDRIRKIMLPKARALVEQHRSSGDTLLVITATNRFVTEPIVREYGIENLLAIELEKIDGRYTGKSTGVPSFKEGKVTRLKSWIDEHKISLEGAYFYSDSHNDLPLLKLVDYPIAVDPDEELQSHAEANNWRVISLR
jgi:HAD superfamily hydrolase (TIGR01490 family)